METKGILGGQCFRYGCGSFTQVEWYHYGTRKYYCKDCASSINDGNPEAEDYYGHPLCVYRGWDLKEISKHKEVQNLSVVEGDILDTPADYHIAHQCNCTTTSVSGVAAAIFNKWPISNTYLLGPRRFGSTHRTRENKRSPTITNLNSQRDKGKPRSKFEEIERLIEFSRCLEWVCDRMRDSPPHERTKDGNFEFTLAMPYLIGSDLAGEGGRTTITQ